MIRFTRPSEMRPPIVGGVASEVVSRFDSHTERTSTEYHHGAIEIAGYIDTARSHVDQLGSMVASQDAIEIFGRLMARTDANDWYYGDLAFLATQDEGIPMRVAWMLLGELVGAGYLEAAFLVRHRADGLQKSGFEALPGNDRKALLRQNGGSHTEAEWEALKRAYDYRCLKCGKQEPEINLTKDHVIPVTLGGPDCISNLQVLCHGCNASKNNRIIDYRPRVSRAALVVAETHDGDSPEAF